MGLVLYIFLIIYFTVFFFNKNLLERRRELPICGIRFVSGRGGGAFKFITRVRQSRRDLINASRHQIAPSLESSYNVDNGPIEATDPYRFRL